jgi:hypothetical protein
MLHSRGVGESVNEEFAFHAANVPEPGEYAVGEIEDNAYHVVYSRGEGNKRAIFRGLSGVLRITESTSDRVTGSFVVQAILLYDCILEPGIPAPFLNCEPAREQANVEITGSFYAVPLGGGARGLTRYPG